MTRTRWNRLSRIAGNCSLLLIAALLICSAAGSAWAQVRSAPDGNSLPEPEPPAQLESIMHDLDEHGHPPGFHDHDDHDHAGQAHADGASAADRARHEQFAAGLNLDDFRKLAVFDAGRTKILDTLAREQLSRIYGKTRWKDPQTGYQYDPVFTLLDLIFAKERYFSEPLIHIEVLELRRAMLAHMPADEQERWLQLGRLTPNMFAIPEVQEALQAADADLRLAKARNQVLSALLSFDQLDQKLLVVSPPQGSEHWVMLHELGDARLATANPAAGAAGLADPQIARQVLQQYRALRDAWGRMNATDANAAVAQLTQLIPQLNPPSYPSSLRRNLEGLYNATHKFTIGHVAYLLATITLLVAFRTPRPAVIRTGIALLLVGFAIHLAGIMVRGYLAHRWWSIHNQFESFIAIAWFAVLGGIILMWMQRQWMFGAAAAALGTCTLMLANTVEIPSNEVAPVAGILATSRILYVHVNMVLASYGLIGLGFFVSLFYLGLHYSRGQSATQLVAAGLGQIDTEGDAESAAPLRGREALLRDLDQAQMVVLQLAFWVLGAGILMGAYWADHAWGRWWAWDPKETWALITWIVYLAVIHLRFAVRRRGLVTAWMSIGGFVIMLWTYWGVNLLLAGLHSYA